MIRVNGMYYGASTHPQTSEKGECGGALTSVLRFLLEEKEVDAVLTVEQGFDIYDATPVLIKDPTQLIETAGSLHCGTLNFAPIITKYIEGAKNMKLAVVTKPCDNMALVELAKRGEIDRENIILIGINCGGTLPPIETYKILKNYDIDPDHVSDLGVFKGDLIIETDQKARFKISLDKLENDGYGRRTNCRRCEYNIPSMVDLAFGNWGVIGDKIGQYSFIEVKSELGADILHRSHEKNAIKLEKAIDEGLKVRLKIDKSMSRRALKWQEKDFKRNMNDIISIFFSYADEFSKCIKCYGCRDSCPICYCEECNLEQGPEWINPGKIPPDPLFHLERFIHMIDSCVNCGQCEDVCPMEIPLSKISHEMNISVREIFGYRPGIDEKKPPLSYFFDKKHF